MAPIWGRVITMKQIAGLLLGAVVLVLAGVTCLALARVERNMADAQQHTATFQYATAGENLDAAERYLGYGRLTAFGRATTAEIHARKAAVQYWQQQYEALLPAGAEPVGAVDDTNVELQLVVANAAYRLGQTQAADRASILQALEEASVGYLTVLKNDTWHPDAAFNYEYVVRLHDEIAKGRRPPSATPPKTELGQSGEPATATKLGGFQIYVPLQPGERNPAGGEAGEGAPRPRKG